MRRSFNPRIGGDRVRFGDNAKAASIRADGSIFIAGCPEDANGFLPFGWLNFALFNKSGIKQLESQAPNLVVNQGKNDFLNTYFVDGTQIASTSWFMGLIVDTGFTGIVSGDTAASHSGWSEFTSYSQSTRVVWGQGAPSSGVTTITNASPVTFDITGTGTLKGGFIISQSTKGGTSGKLWAAALFASPVPVGNGDQMKCTYNLSC